jgi:hypothetical protein
MRSFFGSTTENQNGWIGWILIFRRSQAILFFKQKNRSGLEKFWGWRFRRGKKKIAARLCE